MTRRLLLSYLLLTGFVLLVLEIPLGFSLTHNAEHDMLRGVGHDAIVLASLVEDTVEQRQVKLGQISGRLRVVESGLTGDEWVITEGLQRAVPGNKVDPEKKTMTAGAGE